VSFPWISGIHFSPRIIPAAVSYRPGGIIQLSVSFLMSRAGGGSPTAAWAFGGSAGTMD
jgi:hypothetical protein